jgi:hypothetical protein
MLFDLHRFWYVMFPASLCLYRVIIMLLRTVAAQCVQCSVCLLCRVRTPWSQVRLTCGLSPTGSVPGEQLNAVWLVSSEGMKRIHEKLMFAHLIKTSSVFHGSRRFIACSREPATGLCDSSPRRILFRCVLILFTIYGLVFHVLLYRNACQSKLRVPSPSPPRSGAVSVRSAQYFSLRQWTYGPRLLSTFWPWVCVAA